VRDLGMELHAVDRPLAVAQGGVRRVVARRRASRSSSGMRVIWSPWLIHTRVERPPSASSGSKARDAGCPRGRTPSASRAPTSPPKARLRTFIPVADAEDGGVPVLSISSTGAAGWGASAA
jgi:hypothetical protein